MFAAYSSLRSRQRAVYLSKLVWTVVPHRYAHAPPHYAWADERMACIGWTMVARLRAHLSVSIFELVVLSSCRSWSMKLSSKSSSSQLSCHLGTIIELSVRTRPVEFIAKPKAQSNQPSLCGERDDIPSSSNSSNSSSSSSIESSGVLLSFAAAMALNRGQETWRPGTSTVAQLYNCIVSRILVQMYK